MPSSRPDSELEQSSSRGVTLERAQDHELPLPELPPEENKLSWPKRAVRGVILLGAIAAVALVVVLPETDGSSALETALPTSSSTTAPAPITRAESLQDTSAAAVQISLERSSSLDEMELRAGRARAGTPADSPDGFEAAIKEAVASDPAPTTTTTVWEEPPIPPESEWVDTGNGVAVPDILLRIRFCESTNNYNAANSGSSARGAYQFLSKSWDWYGHAGITGIAEAHLATPAQQDEAALRTLQAQGTGPWAESRPCWNDPGLDPRYATAKPPVTNTDDAATSTTTTTTPQGEGESTDGSAGDSADPDPGGGEDGGDSTDTPDTTVPDTTDTTETTVADTTPESTVPDDGSAGQDQ